MPHLPATSKERKQADLERRVQRILDDRRFQGLRGRSARRALAVVAALCSLGIVPAYAVAGSIVGILVTGLAWLAWWLLRLSTRTIADLPDRFLDERQRLLRDRSYLDAYRIYAGLIACLATVALVAFVAVSQDDAVQLVITWPQAFGLVMFMITLAAVLPSMVVAWREQGEPAELPA
ncbi:MAG: hypothetical protein KGP12_08220 [Actinomycetales bacterium]|nr:hypothetical protein [Actinomycetales bacterium]